MSPRYCACTLALMALATPLAAQGTPVPTAGMAVRWHDASGPRNGTITSVMPDGSYIVDLRDPDDLPLAFVVVVDPAKTPGLEVRVAHQSHRTLGAVVGGAAGLMVAMAAVASKSPCSLFDDDFGSCAGGRVALGLGVTGATAAVGAVIAGESSTWIPVPAHDSPVKREPGVTVRPLLTWHEGPAAGISVRF